MKQLGLSLKQESSVIKTKKKGQSQKERKEEREGEGREGGRKEEGSKGINIGAELGDHRPEFDFFFSNGNFDYGGRKHRLILAHRCWNCILRNEAQQE